jgi:carboxylesterase
MTVRCPLLSGHGTSWQDLKTVRWRDWVADAEAAYAEIRRCCDHVFVAGLSLGSLLALWLGAEHPVASGLIAMAPAVKLRTRLVPLSLGLRYLITLAPQGSAGDADLGDPEGLERTWSYDEMPMWSVGEAYLLQRRVRRMLSKVDQPILVFGGELDDRVPPEAATLLLDSVSSRDRTHILLENSGHNILIDGERELVWERSYTWMMERAAPPRM